MKKTTKIFVVLSFCMCIASIALFAVLAVNQFSFSPSGTIEFVTESGVEATISKATLTGISKKSGSGEMNSFSVTEDMTTAQIQALAGYKSWATPKLQFVEDSNGVGHIRFNVKNNSQKNSHNIMVRLSTNTTIDSKVTATPSSDFCIHAGDSHNFDIEFIVQDPTQSAELSAFAVTIELDLIITDEVVEVVGGTYVDGEWEMGVIFEEHSRASIGSVQNCPAIAVLPEVCRYEGKVYTFISTYDADDAGSSSFGPVSNAGYGFKSLTIPNTYNYIGDYTFYNCVALETLVLPNSVETIGYSAFYNCQKLSGTLTLPLRLYDMFGYAFYNCGFSGALKIPRTVETISQGVFQYSEKYTSLKLPHYLFSIGDNAFEGCTGMTGRLVLPKDMESIGDSAFYMCGFTGSLVIPEGVTYIYDSAFAECPNFSGQLTLPSTIELIDSDAFLACKFNTVLCYAEEVPTLNQGGLAGVESVNGTVYVLDDLYQEYWDTENWDSMNITRLSNR